MLTRNEHDISKHRQFLMRKPTIEYIYKALTSLQNVFSLPIPSDSACKDHSYNKCSVLRVPHPRLVSSNSHRHQDTPCITHGS